MIAILIFKGDSLFLIKEKKEEICYYKSNESSPYSIYILLKGCFFVLIQNINDELSKNLHPRPSD